MPIITTLIPILAKSIRLDKKLIKPEIKVELITDGFVPKPIEYGTGDLEKMGTIQVGTHSKPFNKFF